MEEIIEKNFDKAFAIAWSENQGSYSEDIAKKTLNFVKLQGLRVNSVLDICCGSANFLAEMRAHGKKCTGTEILDSYIEYDKAKYPDIDFHKTEEIIEFDHLGMYDLITCNHDVINMLPTLEVWGEFFKRAYRHLNNGGILIFDYYTKRKLQDWNEVTYDENDKLDYVRNVVSDGQNSTSISNIYYININQNTQDENVSVLDREYSLNNYNNKYKKTEDTTVEYYFENNDILEQIKKAGYRYLITTDANFSPVAGLSDMNRLHVIAIKREVAPAPGTVAAQPQPAPQAPAQPAQPTPPQATETVENTVPEQPEVQAVPAEAPIQSTPDPVVPAPVVEETPTIAAINVDAVQESEPTVEEPVSYGVNVEPTSFETPVSEPETYKPAPAVQEENFNTEENFINVNSDVRMNMDDEIPTDIV